MVRMPAVAMLSLMPIGMPCRGPGTRPASGRPPAPWPDAGPARADGNKRIQDRLQPVHLRQDGLGEFDGRDGLRLILGASSAMVMVTSAASAIRVSPFLGPQETARHHAREVQFTEFSTSLR